MRHQLDKHIPIVDGNVLSFGEFWGNIGGYSIFR